MIVFFFGIALSSIVGIDIGSEIIRASYIRSNSVVDVLSDMDGNRFFQLFLTLVPKIQKKHEMNEKSANSYNYRFNDKIAEKKYPNMTIHHYSCFVGRIRTEKLLESMNNRRFNFEIGVTTNNRIELSGLLPEVLFGIHLSIINQSISGLESPFKPSMLVMAVPKFFMQQERDSLRKVAKFVGFNPFIVDQSKALCFYFAIENKKIISSKPCSIAFVDIGASNTQIIVSQFRMSKSGSIIVNETYYEWDDEIGGRDFDVCIYELIVEKYGKKITIQDEVLIIQEAKAIKHRLSVSSYAYGVIECSSPINYNISRLDFEKSITKYMGLISKLCNFSGTVNRVQMVGGCSRIPIIQETIRKAFNVKKLYFSMNPEEALSIASTYIGVNQSQNYDLPQISYNSLSIYDYYIQNYVQEYPINAVFPYYDENFWIKQIGQKIPTGSSIFILWDYINIGAKIGQTRDGLFRIQNLESKRQQYWKVKANESIQAISSILSKQVFAESIINQLEQIIFEAKAVLSNEYGNITTIDEISTLQDIINVSETWIISLPTLDFPQITKKYQMMISLCGSIFYRIQNKRLLPKVLENQKVLFQKIIESLP